MGLSGRSGSGDLTYTNQRFATCTEKWSNDEPTPDFLTRIVPDSDWVDDKRRAPNLAGAVAPRGVDDARPTFPAPSHHIGWRSQT
jgi:hypothetical protein